MQATPLNTQGNMPHQINANATAAGPPRPHPNMAAQYAHMQAAKAEQEATRKTKRAIKPTVAFDGAATHNVATDGTNPTGAAYDDDDETRRVTVWNPKTGKKLSGNAGVFKRNLARYLRTHPDWIVWTGQDKDSNFRRKRYDVVPSPKRKRVNDYQGSDAKRTAYQNQPREMPTSFTLWKSLLAVCSEKSILAEEDDSSEELEDSQGGADFRSNPYSRCIDHATMSYKQQQAMYSPPGFMHKGLMSPAVG